MPVPKYLIGPTLILAAVILVRLTVHGEHPAPGMSPDQIWFGMPAALKTIVLAASLLFSYGCWTLIRDAVNRLARKNRDANTLAPAAATVWSRFQSGHPVAWAVVMGVGLLAALGLGYIRALADLGGGPRTDQGTGYLVGSVVGPLIMACIGVGIYYGARKNRRTSRQVISALVGWTMLLSALGFAGAAGRLGHSPQFPRDEQEVGRMMGQAYKEASGAVPPEQYSKDEFVTQMRDMCRDIIQFRQQYREAMGQFHTPEMMNLYSASSFRNRRVVEETVRQLREFEKVEGQFLSLDSVFLKTEGRIQQTSWSEDAKRDFVRGMQDSLGQTDKSRLALYQTEKKWIDASVDLYTCALNNPSSISVRQDHVVISDQATLDTFDQKLNRAEGLHREFVRSSKQYRQRQANAAKTYGLSSSDLASR